MKRFLTVFLIAAIYGMVSYGSGRAQSLDIELKDSVLIIGGGAKKIPAYSFRDRHDIAEVRFAAGSEVMSIEEYAFLGCINLKKISLPSTLVTFGEGCFRECESLEEITIPHRVKKLPKYLFYFCENLKRIDLPSGLGVIERNSFTYCRNLESITFPKTLTNIGMNAFTRCESLQEIVIPASVTSLESYAFSDCRGLKRITFPANGRELGELILSGCDSLERIIEPSVRVPSFECNSLLFEPDETEKYAVIEVCVPAGSVSAYRNAGGWKMFKNIGACED